MLLAAVTVGASRVLAEPTSGSLERALNPLLLNVWYVLLTTGSVIALTGVFWRHPAVGLRVEQAGLIMLTSAGLVYGGALVGTAGWKGLAAAAFIFAFAVACALRARDTGRILSRIRALGAAQEVVLNEGD